MPTITSTPTGPNFGQQAARASWIAPLIVFGLGFCTLQMRETDKTTARVIGTANAVILLAGIVLAIVALAGMKKWGRRGVLAPALAGLGIYVVLFLLILSVLLPSLSRAKQAAAKIRAEKMEQEGRDAFMEDGWFGVLRYNGAVITITTINDNNSFGSSVRGEMTTPVSLAIVSVDNKAGASIDIDTKGAVIDHINAASVPALDTMAVLQTAKPADRAEVMATFAPPFHVLPGTQLNGKMLFLPAGMDFHQIAGISISVDGQLRSVPGRFYTAAEKAELLQRAKSMAR